MQSNNVKIEQLPIQRFGLKFIRISEAGTDKEFYKPQILVDDEPIPEKLPIDLRQLVQALTDSGAFYIFTCGCGDAMCVGVEDGVEVRQHDEITEWRYRLPQSTDGFGTDDIDPYEAWVAGSEEIRNTFEKQQAIFAVLEALRVANISHGPKAEYPPYGFERQHISELLQTVDALFKEQPLDLTNLPFDPALEVAKLAGIPIRNIEERGDKDGKSDF